MGRPLQPEQNTNVAGKVVAERSYPQVKAVRREPAGSKGFPVIFRKQCYLNRSGPRFRLYPTHACIGNRHPDTVAVSVTVPVQISCNLSWRQDMHHTLPIAAPVMKPGSRRFCIHLQSPVSVSVYGLVPTKFLNQEQTFGYSCSFRHVPSSHILWLSWRQDTHRTLLISGQVLLLGSRRFLHSVTKSVSCLRLRSNSHKFQRLEKIFGYICRFQHASLLRIRWLIVTKEYTPYLHVSASNMKPTSDAVRSGCEGPNR